MDTISPEDTTISVAFFGGLYPYGFTSAQNTLRVVPSLSFSILMPFTGAETRRPSGLALYDFDVALAVSSTHDFCRAAIREDELHAKQHKGNLALLTV